MTTPRRIQRNRTNGRRELSGRNLMCWCPSGAPCHADLLLELANGEPK